MPQEEKPAAGRFLYWPIFPWVQEPQPWILRKKRPAAPEPDTAAAELKTEPLLPPNPEAAEPPPPG